MEEDEDDVEKLPTLEVSLGELRVAPTEVELVAAAAKAHVASLGNRLGNGCHLTTPQELYALLKRVQPTEIDLDTEFTGKTNGEWDRDFDIKTESCYLRVYPFFVSMAFVGCPEGIVFEPTPEHVRILRAYIVQKQPVLYAHKAGVDVHALHALGILLAGIRVVDTLQCAKWFFPSYERFGLDYLHRMDFPDLTAKTLTFGDVFKFKSRVVWTQLETREKEIVICLCGVTGCRKRTKPEHEKGLDHIYVDVPLKKSKTFEAVITPAELRENLAAWLAFANYARNDVEMLHRWRTRMLDVKVNLPARAFPPLEVRFA